MTTNAMRTTNDQDLNCDPLGRGAEDCDATPVRGLSYLMIINIVINYNFNIIWIELVGILRITRPVHEIPHDCSVRVKRGAVVENERAAGG